MIIDNNTYFLSYEERTSWREKKCCVRKNCNKLYCNFYWNTNLKIKKSKIGGKTCKDI